MPAAQRALVVVPGGNEIGELLELVRATRGQILERRLLAVALNTLAAWLSEQARLLTESETDEPISNVRLLRATPRRTRTMLTPREREVASRIARGLSNRQIADELVIALGTTERHVANILSKLDMRSRAQVAAWVTRQDVQESQPAPRGRRPNGRGSV
jgi:DNA-binding NarL/FixJ family response regulator